VDGFFKILVKLIPTEALAVYIVIKSIAPANLTGSIVNLLIGIGSTIFTMILIINREEIPPNPLIRKEYQVGVATISFVIWTFSSGDLWMYVGN